MEIIILLLLSYVWFRPSSCYAAFGKYGGGANWLCRLMQASCTRFRQFCGQRQWHICFAPRYTAL